MSKRKELKQILKEKGYDLASFTLDKNKTLTKLLVGLTYPITGNLSRKTQDYLEDKLTFIYSKERLDKNKTEIDKFWKKYKGYWEIDKDKNFFLSHSDDSAYNKLISTATSILTNLTLFGYLISKAPEFYQQDMLYINALVVSYAPVLFFETINRTLNLFERETISYSDPNVVCVFSRSDREATGSVLGKLISLPFEWYLKHKENKNK
ncbi:MAG: hypothetical protein AABW56_05605 [Nanoarchaeota archaeon]